MIRAVIVDWGGVLTLTPPQDELERLARLCGCDLESFEAAWRRHRPDYDLGELTGADFWRIVAPESDGILAELLDADAAAWSHPNPPIADWLADVKAAGLRTALLSNVPREQWQRLAPVFERALASCDERTLSFELGLAKPDERIYRHCLDRLGVAAEDALFVDDLAPNVEAARAVGLDAIHYEGLDKLRAELRERRLPVPR